MSSLVYVRDTASNKNVPLQVDSSNKLNVSDTSAQSTLSTISSTLSGSLSVNDTMAQSSLSNIDTTLSGTVSTSDGAAQLSLSAIESSVAGTLSVSDLTAQGSLSSIDTRLAGTISTTQGVSRTNGNVSVSATVINGDVTSSIDANNFKSVMVFGNLGASGDITIQVSNDNLTFYDDSNSNYYSNYSSYDVAGRFDASARYWRVKYNVSSTVTIRYAMVV